MPIAPTPFKFFCRGCHWAVLKWQISGKMDGGRIACAKHQKELEEELNNSLKNKQQK